MAIRNNVTRLLDSQKIPYTPFEFPVKKYSALEVAHLLQVPSETVYKTIVLTRIKRAKPILAVVPGSHQVDPKALAKALGEKKVKVTTEREAEKLTGLQTGGISPLALLHRPFTVVLDASAQSIESMIISGGQRGFDLKLGVEDFIKLTQADLAPICR